MIPLVTVLKMLRIAMGYGSRTDRLEQMIRSNDAGVSMTAYTLVTQGYLDRITGSVVLNPAIDKRSS